MSRAYVPLSLAQLRAAIAGGRVPVLDAVRAASESEEDEYAAMHQAADRSQEQLVSSGRRVVAVVSAQAGASVPIDDLLAVHADTEDIEAGEPDPPELGWFAVQELADLVSDLDS